MPDRAAQLQQHRRAEEERAARARERAQALLKVLYYCFTTALLLFNYCFPTSLLMLY